MSKKSFLILPAFLLLTACEANDKDLVLDFVNTWLEARGMLTKNEETGQYKPTLAAAGVALGASSGDKQVDAAIQGGGMVKNIAEMDKKMKNGKYLIHSGGSEEKREEGKSIIDAGVNARPNDWYYRNIRAWALFRDGDVNGGRKDLYHAERSCQENPRCLGAMHNDRIEQFADLEGSIGYEPRSCAALQSVIASHDAIAKLGLPESLHHQSEAHNKRAVQAAHCQ